MTEFLSSLRVWWVYRVCQVPTKSALSLPLSAGQEKENVKKGLWVEIKTGRHHSAIAIMGKADSA